MNQAELIRIQAQLKHFDCNATETTVYIKCLELGSSSVQEIAHGLRKNRVTVHSAIEQLIDKGLLVETRKGKRRLIAAEDPEVLYRLLEKKRNELNVMETNLDYVASLLKGISHSGNKPSIKFYEGADGLKKMMEETLESKSDVLVFSYVELLAEATDPIYLENYFKRRAKKGIHTQLIFPPVPFAKKVAKKAEEYDIEVRLLPDDPHWKSGIFAWDNKLAILSYQENSITTTIIENTDIAHFYRNIIFPLCWGQAKGI